MKNKLKYRFICILAVLTALGLIVLKTPLSTAAITNPVIGELGAGEPGDVFARTFAALWKAAVVAGGIAFILYFILGALRWMTAESDKAKFESGRENMTNAAIGLVLLVASVAIIQLLGELLNIEFLENLSFTLPAA